MPVEGSISCGRAIARFMVSVQVAHDDVCVLLRMQCAQDVAELGWGTDANVPTKEPRMTAEAHEGLERKKSGLPQNTERYSDYDAGADLL